jgi:hypothetical protein
MLFAVYKLHNRQPGQQMERCSPLCRLLPSPSLMLSQRSRWAFAGHYMSDGKREG